MSKMLFQMYGAAVRAKGCAKEKVHQFLTEERGGAEIIAGIILVAIVVVLAVAFREQIQGLITKIWSGVNESSDEFNKGFDLTTPPT